MPGPGNLQPTSHPRPQTRSLRALSVLSALIVLAAIMGCGKGAYIDRLDKRVKALHSEAEANKKNADSGRPNIPGAEGDAAADGAAAEADASAEGAATDAAEGAGAEDGAAAEAGDGGAPPEEPAAGGEAPAE